MTDDQVRREAAVGIEQSVPPAARLLRDLLLDAAAGKPPAADGKIDVVPSPAPGRHAVVAFTGHTVVAADVSPDEVHAHLPDDDFGAPMSPAFLCWLAERLGATAGNLDVVLAAPPALGTPEVEVYAADTMAHARVQRAHRHRHDVRMYAESFNRGVVVLGRGLAGRWEVAFEVDPIHRDAGLGRLLAAAAPHLVPADEHVFAQIAPGNSASLRAALAAGYVPLGSEVLFHAD